MPTDIHAPCRERIAALEAIVATQQKLIVRQQKTIDALTRKVEKLEACLKQNSRNSSCPPSSDPPWVAPRPPKPPTGRKPGGQPGHEGHPRKLLPPEDVHELAEVKPEKCQRCGRKLRGSDPHPVRHQVTELPAITAQTDEWRLHALMCPCGHTTRAALPDGVPKGAFGPRLQATLAYLTGVARLTKRPIEEVVQDLFGVSISLGAIVAQQQAVSEAVAPAVEEAKQYAQTAEMAHSDETGWKEGPKGEGERGRKKAWLWVMVTPSVTVFLIHASRGAKAARALLGRFSGWLVSDRWNGYNGWSVRKRQLCWAHLIRDWVGFTERGKAARQIGKGLLRKTEKMFEWWYRVRDGTLARSTFQVYMRPIRRRVRALLRKGTRCGEPKTEGMCKMILKLEPAMWTFVRVEGLEPTNNTAERAIRHAVLYRKGCFGTHSETGSRFVERILTVVATLRQQGRNVMEYLTLTCTSSLHGKRAPSLLPFAAQRAVA